MANVLVVDDSPQDRELATAFLSDAGHTTASAPNGREALAALIRDTPDVVVVDLRMPEMDGVSLLGVIRSYLRLQSLPVVVMTGYPHSRAAERAQALGIKALVEKVEGWDGELVRAVEAALAPTDPEAEWADATSGDGIASNR